MKRDLDVLYARARSAARDWLPTLQVSELDGSDTYGESDKMDELSGLVRKGERSGAVILD